MKWLNIPSEIKAPGDAGTFSGYASIFGNIDLGGDIVERGAFKEIMANANGKVTALWQHDSRAPIGVVTVRQDDKGLAFDGELVLEDATARKALAHMKAGSVQGMSIGFDILPGGAEILESGIRVLKNLRLWEVSVVTWGMNPLAGVISAKDRAGMFTDIRAFETFLRDEGGFSNTQAKRLAAGGWRALEGNRDDSGMVTDGAEVLQFLRSINQP